MPAEFDNAIQTLCELSESSDELLRIPENGPDRGAELRFMMGLGAIEFGARPETVVCGACDADHPAAIEYDSERRCYVHFCPEAGFVTVNDAVLTTYRYRPEWLVDCLVKALHVISPVRPRAIVPACAWHLGDTKCGNTLVTIVFARRIAGQLALGQLASALRAV